MIFKARKQTDTSFEYKGYYVWKIASHVWFTQKTVAFASRCNFQTAKQAKNAIDQWEKN